MGITQGGLLTQGGGVSDRNFININGRNGTEPLTIFIPRGERPEISERRLVSFFHLGRHFPKTRSQNRFSKTAVWTWSFRKAGSPR